MPGILTIAYIAAVLLVSAILALCELVFPARGAALLFSISPSLLAFGFAAGDRDRPLRDLGWRPAFRYWIEIFGVIALLTIALLLVAWSAGQAQLNAQALAKFLRLTTLAGLLLGILQNSGEEAGWRGYLFPKLYRKLGWWRAIVVSALVWWAWHVPMMAVLQARESGEVQWGTQLVQLLSLFPVSVLLSIWYLESRSFWAVGFAHQLGNFVDKWCLGLAHSAKTPIFFQSKSLAHLYSLENGVLGLIGVTLAAVIVFRRHAFPASSATEVVRGRGASTKA